MNRQRTYAGVAADQRRAQRRDALLEAALDIIAERGVAGLTVRAACQRAGLNDRYFRESFTDIDELTLTLVDREVATATAMLVAAPAGVPLERLSRARAIVRAALAYLESDPRRKRLLTESQASEPLRRRRHEVTRLLAAIIVTQTADLIDRSSLSETEIEVGSLTLASGGVEVLAMWARGDLDLTLEQLSESLVTTFVRSAGGAESVQQTPRALPNA